MATLRKPLLLMLATLVVTGCSTIEKKPMQVPSGDLDYKPAPTQPARLDLKKRMPKFVLPATVADTKLYSFRATAQPVRLALSQFATAYQLNIVMDQDVDGLVTVDLKGLPLEKVLEAMLEPIGLAWQWQDGLLRVSLTETRTFVIDYLRLVRSGAGDNSSSSSLSGSGGTSSIAQNDTIDFWNELEEQLKEILARSDNEYTDRDRPMETTVQTDRATNITTTLTKPVKESEGRLVIDRLSGTIQVTTSRARMKNVVEFLNRVDNGIKRQVYIEAKVVEVALNDDFALGINWNELVIGSLTLGSTVAANPADGATALASTFNGSYIRTFDNPYPAIDYIDASIDALQEQGQVQVVSQPRIRTLNNQPAIIRVGTDRTFFSKKVDRIQDSNGNLRDEITYEANTVTDGLMLTVTPQISESGEITMDVSPVLTHIAGIDESPDRSAQAPRLEIKQASTLVRMGDGETIVVGGLIQETDSNAKRSVPGLGDMPGVGGLFSGTYDRSARKELVIFITPHIIE